METSEIKRISVNGGSPEVLPVKKWDWRIILGRGIDYFQSLSGNYFQIGDNNQDLRPCLETSIDFINLN